jgi:hypothetical protein
MTGRIEVYHHRRHPIRALFFLFMGVLIGGEWGSCTLAPASALAAPLPLPAPSVSRSERGK